MKTPILCRIGLHDWKPEFKFRSWGIDCFGATFQLPEPRKVQVACQCRRCGKRVDV